MKKKSYGILKMSSDKKGENIFEDLFDETKIDEFTFDETHEPQDVPEAIPAENAVPTARKRSFKDFQPDMDALLITAQSPMIIEGMKIYTDKDFSASTLPVYQEALKGVELYITIIDRNPQNYHKLKAVINSDIDCQEVEKTAFNLYATIHGQQPETYPEKVDAFEKFRSMFRDAVNRATISTSTKDIKKYFLISGGIDEIKIQSLVRDDDPELKKDAAKLTQTLKVAINYLERGNMEIIKGLKGRDLNSYVVKGSSLLTYYYSQVGNEKLADYFKRVNSIYSKYYVIRD